LSKYFFENVHFGGARVSLGTETVKTHVSHTIKHTEKRQSEKEGRRIDRERKGGREIVGERETEKSRK
jgi:hypothetical protein